MDMQKTTGEISRSSERLTAENRLFFTEMARVVRKSPLNEQKAEEVLLDTLRRMLKLQERGGDMRKTFGEDPKAYAEELLSDIYMRKPRTAKDKIRYYVMIPWVALTWVFFIYAVIGFFGRWMNSDFTDMHINTTTLLLIAVGSIVLIELLTRIMGANGDGKSSSASGKPQSLKTEVRTLAITIVAAVIALGLYVALGHFLPSFSASPWVCLVVFIVGFIGQFLLMPRKPRMKA